MAFQLLLQFAPRIGRKPLLPASTVFKLPKVFEARYGVPVQSQTVQDRVEMLRQLSQELSAWADAVEWFGNRGCWRTLRGAGQASRCEAAGEKGRVAAT